MRADSVAFPEITKLSDHTAELARLRACDDDDRIDQVFNAICRRIWGYTLDDFDDESLSAKDHTFLDRLTWKRAAAFGLEHGYDLVDHATGDMVPDWWGFAWMILAEQRGLLTPEGREATWRRYAARLKASSRRSRAWFGVHEHTAARIARSPQPAAPALACTRKRW